MSERHCATCVCGRRASVQASSDHKKGPGSVGWTEHEEAWSVYASKYGRNQSAERIDQRGGFSYAELVMLLGREPTTWVPVAARTREARHVDDFIDDASSDFYAASWFASFRRPAVEKLAQPDARKLFATYQGIRYRVVGCSRLGDVWLSSKYSAGVENDSYERRVDVDACSEWSDEP